MKTTEHRPDKTLPDGGHEPIDKTTLPTDPKEEPTTTEKKKEPHNTEPHGTEPHNTEPGDGDGEPTTTDGEEHHYEWSVHQLKGSTDAEPVTEVFWVFAVRKTVKQTRSSPTLAQRSWQLEGMGSPVGSSASRKRRTQQAPRSQ